MRGRLKHTEGEEEETEEPRESAVYSTGQLESVCVN